MAKNGIFYQNKLTVMSKLNRNDNMHESNMNGAVCRQIAAFGVGWLWLIRVANNNIDMNITIDNSDMF